MNRKTHASLFSKNIIMLGITPGGKYLMIKFEHKS